MHLVDHFIKEKPYIRKTTLKMIEEFLRGSEECRTQTDISIHSHLCRCEHSETSSEADMEVEEICGVSSRIKSFFYRWRTNLINFWTYFSMILVRWWKPRQKEGRFTHLFMAFSKICLLYPEPGKMYPESINFVSEALMFEAHRPSVL